MIESMRKQRPVFNEVERAAQDTIASRSTSSAAIDGAEFDGGSGTGRALRHRRRTGS